MRGGGENTSVLNSKAADLGYRIVDIQNIEYCAKLPTEKYWSPNLGVNNNNNNNNSIRINLRANLAQRPITV
jgi:hypothetical protein